VAHLLIGSVVTVALDVLVEGRLVEVADVGPDLLQEVVEVDVVRLLP